MKKIEVKSVGETIYFEKLDNGLEIYMLPKKIMNNIYATFNTKYGSMHNEFIPIDKKKVLETPTGVAHFLEHKMFERENGEDPLVFYARHGAEVNAATSYKYTHYMFYGTGHLEENINYLLNFVQAPYFSEESIEKEKKVIEQEIKMYNDDPYSVLYDGIRFNTFVNDYIRYPIGGTVEDINSITKDILYDCYNTFYHPTNMFLVVTGNFDPEKLVDIVKKNQTTKKFKKINKINIKKIEEPDTVCKEYEKRKMNVVIPKIVYGIKIPIKNIKMNPIKRNNYINVLFDILFGNTSLFYEKMKELEYIDYPFSLDITLTPDHLFVSLGNDTKKEKELIEEIKKLLANINISEEDFERKKKVFISTEIYIYESIGAINGYIMSNIINYGTVDYDRVALLRSLNKAEFDNLIEEIDLSNASIFVVDAIDNKR